MLNFREPIYAALFAQLTNPANMKYSWATQSRRFQKWSKDQTGNLPALYVLEGPTDTVTQLNEGGMYGGSKYILKAQIWAYVTASPSDNPNKIPSQQMHAVKDAIETAIQPNIGERQELGGLVENCFVEGDGYCDPGVADTGLIVVMVPVRMITGIRG